METLEHVQSDVATIEQGLGKVKEDVKGVKAAVERMQPTIEQVTQLAAKLEALTVKVDEYFLELKTEQSATLSEVGKNTTLLATIKSRTESHDAKLSKVPGHFNSFASEVRNQIDFFTTSIVARCRELERRMGELELDVGRLTGTSTEGVLSPEASGMGGDAQMADADGPMADGGAGANGDGAVMDAATTNGGTAGGSTTNGVAANGAATNEAPTNGAAANGAAANGANGAPAHGVE